MLQIARITLWQKGTSFDPKHPQKASFRTYILPRICGALTKAKAKEIQHYGHFMHPPNEEDIPNGTTLHDAFPSRVSYPKANFEDTLIWEMWNADFEQALPQLLQRLTKREQQVFMSIRANMKQCDIAENLALSKARVSQLLKQVEQKLRHECQNLGIIE